MLKLRLSKDRGQAQHGWLYSQHTFSFADYHDPAYMGFRDLRVINEDLIDGGTGFGTHPHRDMEIVSYIISGALKHQDSMGNATVILPGDIQRMSAGTGVLHSEQNDSKTGKTHFLQIWLLPAKEGITPSYGQKSFTESFATKNFVLVISPDGRDGSVTINQDVMIYKGRLKKNEPLSIPIKNGRAGWVQLISGGVDVKAQHDHAKLSAGDGLAVEDETSLQLTGTTDDDSEFLYFDLN